MVRNTVNKYKFLLQIEQLLSHPVLIHGATLHSATHVLNKTITQEMIDRWHDACLVIVHAIYFGNKDLLEAVDSRRA